MKPLRPMKTRVLDATVGTTVAVLIAGCGGGSTDAGAPSKGANAAPVANPGTAPDIVAGTKVTLNGSGSSDVDGDALSYAWALTGKPAGSAAALVGATTVAPTFVADMAGVYVVSLVVNDGKIDSMAATITFAATAGVPGTRATCGLANFQSEALALVNVRRAAGAQCGDQGSFAAAPPLAWNPSLTQASLVHSDDMMVLNYFSHTGSDGGNAGQRATAAGYPWSAVGENIAAGQPSVSVVVDGWMASPGHCANIMHAGFRDIGLACVSGSASNTYRTYWTMTLGTPQ